VSLDRPLTNILLSVDAAIVLAALAGCAWAINIVIVRWGLQRTSASPVASAFVGVSVAALVAAGIAVVSGQQLPAADDLWKFALVGAIAPGSSQGLFVAAIGLIGPSRTSVLIGTSPVFSVLLAIVLLDEGWQAAVIVGTALTVLGGVLISWEPGGSARRIGVVLALATALSFGIRDVVARQFNTDSDVSSWWSGAIVLGAAALVLAMTLLARERRNTPRAIATTLPEFLASGLMVGLALPLLLEALDRGSVGVVAPLSLAAQQVTVVVLGAVVFGARERTPRILLALVLVVAGAVLITTV